ncbi:T3SS effector HopA1 family protein [Corynebacterium timonense]|uniref:Uncharacterized protein n=1 Tax=Corynebacterium timonense TaxID=441500 RepID=A0A1H1S3E1_9CORY|nr:T3SS effector HopA1 family protein [Corynebacterium timonense]SDS42474.1 hypothetical protein SAMN04488539_1651 [Corynebacterium timonense]
MKISDEALSICQSIKVDIKPKVGVYHATVQARPRVEAKSVRSLIHQLTYEIYSEFHTGNTNSGDETILLNPRTTRDPCIEQQLSSAVPHTFTEAPGIFVDWLEERTAAVVEFDRTRIEVPVDKILSSSVKPGLPVIVQVPAVRPALSQGFCVVDGPRPLGQPRAKEIRRVYLHVASPDAAAQVWKTVLPMLNALRAPYRTKALSRLQEYPRRDAIVFYLQADTLSQVSSLIMERLSDSCLLEDATSAFAHRLGPGVAVADEPNDLRPNLRGLSFGEHRAQVLADVTVRHALQPQSRLADVLTESLLSAGICPCSLAFNAAETA